ncbi:MAG: MBL fold metallo-hydrolase [Eubacteriales bacterium]|nr:MBL fold metallo-hydrolase [Eubacteriales bacterium]
MAVSVDPLTESNCYVLAEDSRCVIVDPGESENLLRLLEENRWTPELFLLTHEHCDHMAGLDALRDRYPAARFPATEKCDAGIRDPRLNMSRIMEVYLYFRGKPGVSFRPFVCRPADEIIADDAVIEWRGHTFRFVPLPGHTPGSEGIFLDGNMFFCGDYLIREEEPVLRFPGGDEAVYTRVTEPVLRALPEGLLICPGHRERYVLETGGGR